MKIGLVLSKVPAPSETFFISKVKGLQKAGHQVILFANGHLKNKICKSIRHPVSSYSSFALIVLSILASIKLFLIRPFVVLKFIKLESNDGRTFFQCMKNIYLNNHILVSKMDWIHFGFMTFAINRQNLARAINAKMGVSLRGYDICVYPLKHPMCYSNVWGKVDKVHAISHDLLKVSEKLGFSKKNRFQIIKPAIDLEFFRNEKIYFEKKDKINFLTVGRLHWKKGIEDTIHALSLIRDNGILFNYKIVGEGPELERLIYATYDLKLEDYINFVGKVPHEETKNFYKEADIYLQYSVQEGYCNSTIEARSMGLIPIVSNAEGLLENVGNNKLVVEKRNPEKLAEKIVDVINNLEKYDKLLKNSYYRIYDENNINYQIEQFLNFYD